MAKSDIQGRLGYLVSQEGGVRAAARRANIPYSTFRRLYLGENQPSKSNRNRVNRAYRRLAPEAVKRREKTGRGAGFALVDEATARRLEASYRQQGKSVMVTARTEFTYNDNGTQRNDTSYGRGRSVDEAKGNMLNNFAKFGDSYADYSIAGVQQAQYRVIALQEFSA